MKDFKIRCSAIGKIMTNARSKTETLSKTTISYLEEWTKEQIYSRRKEIFSKYLDKGNAVEVDSLDFIKTHLNYKQLEKNEESFENDFLTGTPDAILDDHIIDVKNSWDCFSFPLFFNSIPNKDYYYQAQGYMALTGIDRYKLIYTLMDTPEDLIQREYFGDQSTDLVEFASKYKYSDIEPQYRIKVFDIYRNDEDIENIYNRVDECRQYINSLRLDLNF
jgi:hypothetical protein